MTLNFIALLLATGLLSGTVGGLLGVGGGVVVVPVLIILLPKLGGAQEYVVHFAVATSLFTVFFTNVSSAWAHWRQGNVVSRIVWLAGPSAALAGGGGALLTSFLPGDIHQRIFGGFLLIISLRLLLEKKREAQEEVLPPASPDPESQAPTAPSIGVLPAAGSGAAIGLLAGLLGIGGGSLAVPLFHMGLKLSIHRSVGTSAAVGTFAAVLGTLGHAMATAPPDGGLAHTVGFVHWPAAVIISFVAMITAQFGAWLAGRTHPAPLRRVFGGFLVLVSLKLLY